MYASYLHLFMYVRIFFSGQKSFPKIPNLPTNLTEYWREREKERMGGNRRFAQVATSDDEDDLPPRAPRSVSPTTDEEQPNDRKRKKKKLKLNKKDEDDDEEDRERKKQKKKAVEEVQEEKPASDNEEEVQEDAKPIGDVIRVSGKGKGRRNHYDAFEYDGLRYDLVSHLPLTIFFFGSTE